MGEPLESARGASHPDALPPLEAESGGAANRGPATWRSDHSIRDRGRKGEARRLHFRIKNGKNILYH
jgi:hypothetical protein